MYHPIRVCTPHQILRFALCGRGWETGLSEFPRACFVFDEIHAFEPLLAGLTLATVRLLKSEPFNARILFASATIPRFLENIIKNEIGIDDANVIAPDPKNELDRIVCGKVRHRIEIRSGALLNNLDAIADEIETSNESALIVCNHVATSQQVWKYLREERKFQDVMLLHARFNGEDRNRIEQCITSKNKPKILVSTQAVEVSLDIDYDRGYIEPAPADALGQRLGRINRKGSHPIPAPVIVFDEPSAGHLYDETLTTRTVQILCEVDCLTESQLTGLVDEVYSDGYPPAAMENFKRGIENEQIRDFVSEIVAGTHCQWTEQVIDKSDGQVEVLPDSLLDEYTMRRKERRYVEAGQLLVPIRIGQKFKAEKMSALRYDLKLHEYVTNLNYSSELGLRLDAQSENIF
jgi:CRISPR-associated endonuclease/helicase Cas3